MQCVLVYSSGQDAALAVRLCISTGDLQAKVLHESHDRSKLWGGNLGRAKTGWLICSLAVWGGAGWYSRQTRAHAAPDVPAGEGRTPWPARLESPPSLPHRPTPVTAALKAGWS